MILLEDGTVRIAKGEFGYALPTSRLQGLKGVKAISEGAYGHALFLKEDGTVVATGNNSHLQSEVPPGLRGVKAIAAGSLHSVALKENGQVVVWGATDHQHGNVPSTARDVVAIAAAAHFTLALKSDGTVVG